jgi:hypothetical protein
MPNQPERRLPSLPVPPTPISPPEVSNGNGRVIKACDFQVINFFDQNAPNTDGKLGREIVLLYALGEDGIVREFANGRWTGLPIRE